jgi:hypothetical protein
MYLVLIVMRNGSNYKGVSLSLTGLFLVVRKEIMLLIGPIGQESKLIIMYFFGFDLSKKLFMN